VQFDQTCLPHVKAGKLVGLAMLAEVRHPDFPAIPTLREAGYGKDGGDSWFGILAPAGTSPTVYWRQHHPYQAVLRPTSRPS
jgi:tripartite-type tricarboxylate transporter receptor subunit TctC